MPAPPDTPVSVRFDDARLRGAYKRSDHAALSEALLDLIDPFAVRPILDRIGHQDFIDRVVEHLLYYFTCEEYVPGREHAVRFVRHGPTIAALTALSVHRTTDRALRILLGQQNNLAKILALYNARCHVRLPLPSLVEADPALAAIWYERYFLGADACPREHVAQNLAAHLDFPFDGEDLLARAAGYMRSTYLGVDCERRYKQRFNSRAREAMRAVVVRNRPVRDRIALVSHNWQPAWVAHRLLSPFVAALAERFRLTLVHAGEPRDDLDVTPFDDVRHVRMDPRRLDFSAIVENDFQAVLYADLGVCPETRWLSNLRLAPVQIALLGHPVSSFGSEIDYFVSGEETEIAGEVARHYDEQVRLVPGFGCCLQLPPTARPPATRAPAAARGPRDDGRVVIDCLWGSHKIDPGGIEFLRAIGERAGTPVRFRFFPGNGRCNSDLVLAQDLAEVLGPDRVEVCPYLPHEQHLETLRGAGDLALDAFPYGGFLTVMDLLSVGRPVVAREGWQFYNRGGPALLRRAGLDDLVACSDEERLQIALRLIDDPVHRREVAGRVAAIDTASLAASLADPAAFVDLVVRLGEAVPVPSPS